MAVEGVRVVTMEDLQAVKSSIEEASGELLELESHMDLIESLASDINEEYRQAERQRSYLSGRLSELESMIEDMMGG